MKRVLEVYLEAEHDRSKFHANSFYPRISPMSLIRKYELNQKARMSNTFFGSAVSRIHVIYLFALSPFNAML